jgi:hypothetical protein
MNVPELLKQAANWWLSLLLAWTHWQSDYHPVPYGGSYNGNGVS